MTAPVPQSRLASLNDVVEELSRQHAEDQETIADNLLLALWPLWKLMDFEDLDRTSVLWLDAAVPRVKTAYLQSQAVAAAYEANVRFATLPTADPMPLIAPRVELPDRIRPDHFEVPDFGPYKRAEAITFDQPMLDDIRTSLMIEGAWSIKRHMPVADPETAMADAQKNSAGAAVRQSLKGARNVTNNVVTRDRRIIGYARYTDSNPCHFCGLLASRGAVYSKSSFVVSDPKFTANPNATKVPEDYLDISKVHNHCRCTLRPVYAKSQSFDSDALFYKAQWKDLIKNHPNTPPAEVAKLWRDNYVPYVRQPANVFELQSKLRARESALVDAGFSADSPQVLWAQRTQSLLA